ncbi:MAG: chorismate synthase [Chloroflexi bacterium]|nr:chorismate synthase [Chloroflexota bacterium]
MTKFRFLTAGESHGQGLSVIIEGLPAGLKINEDEIKHQMKRRQIGYGSGGRMKIEDDTAKILSGIRHGYSIGSPISLWIENKDFNNWSDAMSSKEVDKEVDIKKQTKVVPGHADFPGALKYQHNDIRNILERASARETAARVAASSFARIFLSQLGVSIKSRVLSNGNVKDETDYSSVDWDFVEKSEVRASSKTLEKKYKNVIDNTKKNRTTIGGIIQIIASNIVVGLGSHIQWDKKLDGQIAQAMMSINAVKGVEIGYGFDNSSSKGHDIHDVLIPDKNNVKNFSHITNHAGGIEGGMSNGEPIVVNVAIKPIATMTSPLPSVDINTGKIVQAPYNRSDICQTSRACPIGEAMLILILTSAYLDKFGGDHMNEIKHNLDGFIKSHDQFGKS